MGMAPNGNGASPDGNDAPTNEPVSFFQPAGGGQQAPQLGPDGQPIRKRRRRRRRGRGGRNRDFRMQNGGGPGGGEGAGGGGDAGGGGGPPPITGGGDGGGAQGVRDGEPA